MKKIIFFFVATLLLSISAISQVTPSGSAITGTGTANYVPKFTGLKKLGNSLITQTSSLTTIGTPTTILSSMKIRDISNATYFNASGTNGFYFNDYADGTNLLRIKNDGVLVVPQGTSDRILALDANKELVYLNTSVYPDLTQLSYVKGVTSPIQTQLNGKQNNLIGKNNTLIAHTGATVETVVYSFSVAAGTFQANDFLKLQGNIYANANANNKNFKVYVNTVNSVSSATQVAVYAIASVAGGTPFIRNLCFKNSLSDVSCFSTTTSTGSDETLTTNVADTQLTYDFNQTTWFVFTAQTASSASDYLYIKWIRAEIIR